VGEDAKYVGNDCYIITIPSRTRLHLYWNDPDEIVIYDIANSQSKQCRFNGHMVEDAFYSVAEHQVDASFVAKMLGASPFVQFLCQMHDTPEYGLSDIAAPFKPEVKGYKDVENLLWVRIADKFGMPRVLPPLVKKVDWLCLFMEAATFVVPNHRHLLKEWVGWDEHGEEAMKLLKKYTMRGLPFQEARLAFLDRFHQLQAEMMASEST